MPQWVVQCPPGTTSISMPDGRVIPVRAGDWTAHVWAEYPANIIFNNGNPVSGVAATVPITEFVYMVGSQMVP